MFKQTVIALSLLTISTVSTATEITNDTKAVPDYLSDALTAVSATFIGTGSMDGVTYVFVGVDSTKENNEVICDVAVRSVDGDVALFVVGGGGSTSICP